MKYSKECLNRLIFAKMKRFGFCSPVLEVGCGTGETLRFLSKDYNIRGIDLSSEAVAICRKKGLSVDKKGLFEVDQGFNSILCIDVLEHIRDDLSFVRHLHKILREGGKLLVFVPSGRIMNDDLFCGHYRRYSKSAIIGLLKESNFIVESAQMFGYPLIYYIRILMNLLIRSRPRQDLSSEIRTVSSSYKSIFDENVLARAYYKITQVPAFSRIISQFLLFSNLGVNGEKGFSVVIVAKKPQ